MTCKYIDVSLKDGQGTITLNRPPVNVLNIAMMDEINDALDEFQGNKDLKIILFEAKGKCFSAGVDVGEHMGDLAPKMLEAVHGIFRRMVKLGVLTVASVHGSCLGGGSELAIFCDLVIASESAKLGQPEIQVGVFPPIAAFVMPRAIGRKAANDLILSGRVISAEESLKTGLINKVVKDESLKDETEKFIAPYLKLSAEVLRVTKKAMTAGLMDDLEPALKIIEKIYINELMNTHDAHEGLAAFMEKREAVWKND